MLRYKVFFRPSAEKDLLNIFDRVFEVSQHHGTAQQFVSRIIQRCRRVGNVPFGGRPRDDLFAGMRTVPFERSAVIAYVVTDKVEIINIFYGGRDYDAFYAATDSEE
jgi:toxin ParE1/3/4